MRLAIVNDMKLVVQVLRRLVLPHEEFEIAWIAYDGKEAVEKCASDVPDLILMDLIMPVMNGAEATRKIMKNSPCPVLIVTASVSTNASLVFEAMGYGALDAVNTPVIDTTGEVVGGAELFRKIETIASLSDKSTWTPKRRTPEQPSKESGGVVEKTKLVVIGASTGGPLALVKILKQFPENHNYSVVIIQHIDEKFANGLAEWLADLSGHKVEVARQGGRPVPGIIHVAGTNNHLIINALGMYEYTPHPEEKPYRPSVDVFFSSIAEYWPSSAVAVLLTGMGDDGGLGMKELYDKGWYTIAQSQESCVVFGMPRAAIELGAVSKTADIESIPRAIFSAPMFLRIDKRNLPE